MGVWSTICSRGAIQHSRISTPRANTVIGMRGPTLWFMFQRLGNFLLYRFNSREDSCWCGYSKWWKVSVDKYSGGMSML